MTTLWFRHALLPDGWADNVRIDVTESRISAVTPETEPTGTRFDGIAIPGVPNVHSHAFQRGMAGLTQTRGQSARSQSCVDREVITQRRVNRALEQNTEDSFWTWRELMYRFLARLGPEEVEAIAAYAYMRMLEAGYTAVGEFHYLHHDPAGQRYADPAELAGRITRAASLTGIGLTLLPCFYRFGGFAETPPSPGQRRFITDPDGFARLLDASRTHLATLEGAVLGIAPHSLRAVSPPDLLALVHANPVGPIHIHAAEQTREVADCRAALGAPPVEWLLNNAPVDTRWCLIHATHMEPGEVDRLAASGAVAGLCPTTEADLGDGTFAAPEYLRRGGRIGIGSDSNLATDPAAELRQLENAQRLFHRARNLLASAPGESTGMALFRAVLAGGAQALAQPMGALAAGRRADIVVLDADHPDLAARSGDAWIDTWVFAAPPALVRDVISGGAHVVSEGRHRSAEPITARWRAAIGRVLGG